MNEEEEYERIAQKNYDLGRIAALNDMATFFKEKAADVFKEQSRFELSDDREAHSLRNVSKVLDSKAKVEREQYDIHYPKGDKK